MAKITWHLCRVEGAGDFDVVYLNVGRWSQTPTTVSQPPNIVVDQTCDLTRRTAKLDHTILLSSLDQKIVIDETAHSIQGIWHYFKHQFAQRGTTFGIFVLNEPWQIVLLPNVTISG